MRRIIHQNNDGRVNNNGRVDNNIGLNIDHEDKEGRVNYDSEDDDDIEWITAVRIMVAE